MDAFLYKPAKKDEGTQGLALFETPKQAPVQPVATSERAGEKVSPHLSTKRRDLLRFMCENVELTYREGLTDNELIALLVPRGWNHNGIRNRRSELHRGGWLDESGEKDGSTRWRPNAKAWAWWLETVHSEEAA